MRWPPSCGGAAATPAPRRRSQDSADARYTRPMETRVLPAEHTDLETLRNLFQLYAYDFSEVLPLDVDAAGRFSEPQLAAYWADVWHVPYMLRVDDRLGGFALVHRT